MSSRPLRLLNDKKKVIGAKQTKKAIEEGLAKEVYVAKDADSFVVDEIIQLCKKNSLNIVYIDTMTQLGEMCGIDVGSASIALLE